MDDLSLLFEPSPDEGRHLRDRNATAAPVDDRPIDALIWEAGWPDDSVACRSEAGELRRGDFLARADTLAARLRERGIGRGSVVAILAAASAERLVAVAAVLRSGAAFLPIDPGLPDERVRHHCADSRAACVFVDRPNRGRSDSPELELTADLLQPAQDGAFVPDPQRTQADCAYLVYTSGTTGTPKAALNAHRALVNRLQWMARDLGVHHGDRILHKTPFGFDVAVWEQLLPLLCGVPAIIAPEQLRTDPAALAAFMEREAVTLAHFVPTPLAEFVDAVARPPASLRAIVASGEALSPVTARRVLAWRDVALHNYYGPSEAAIDVTATAVREPVPANVPIGLPIQNCRIHLLDRHMQEVPPGAEGEIYIGGIPVGGGYRSRPRLTAERFLPDPFGGGSGERLYRTGDVARWPSGGQIEFLGRSDRQLKLNGMRIEPGEIETALGELLGTRTFVDAFEAPSGARVLVGFAVAGEPFDETQVRERLRERLPSYMVPAMVLPLAAMPTGTTGKADKAALARICAEHWGADEEGAPLSGEAEIALARHWTDLLRREVRSGDAHFFKLGGDSILAIRLVARMREAGWSIAVEDVFDAPTLAELAARASLLPSVGSAGGAFGQAVAAAPPSARAILAPQCLLSPSVDQDALRARLDRLLRELCGAEPALALTADDAAERIADDPALHAALQLPPQGSPLVAFSPTLLDDAAMPRVAAWLDGHGPLPKTASLPGLAAPAWLAALGAARGDGDEDFLVEQLCLHDPDPHRVSAPAAERRIDAVAALVLTALQARAGRPLVALLPESSATAKGAGRAPEFFVGRLGVPAPLPVAAPVAAATVMAARFGGAGEAERIDIVVRRAPRAALDPAEAGRLAAPLVRRGLAALFIGEARAWLVLPASWQGWARGALEAVDPQAARSVLSEAARLRDPRDFPIVGLSVAELARLAEAHPQIEDIYPLAPLQEGMLLRAAYWPESDAYLNQNIVDLHGPLDAAAMRRAWSDVVERYEVLRTGYRWHDLARPLAIVAEADGAPLEELDWSTSSAAEAEEKLADLMAHDRARPFDLARSGLCRMRLIRLSPDHHLMVWTHHHILLDGWCLALIWGDIARCYAARSGAAPPVADRPRPFRDYLVWLRDHGPDEAGRAFWRHALAGARATRLSARTPDVEGAVVTRRCRLADARREALLAAARALGLTANTYIQAAWALLLARWTGSSDVTHGVSISGRPPELEGADAIVGLFINLVPLRTAAAPAATAADYLRSVQAALSAATRQGNTPLPDILAQWEGRRSPHDRLFDSLIAFENYPDDNLPQGEVAGITFADRLCDEKTEYPIGLIVLPDDPFEIHVNYDSAHFDGGTVDRLTADFFALLDALIDYPDEHLANFHAVPEPEAPQPQAPLPVVSLDQLLEAGAADACAMACGRERWTYGELDRAVAATAAMLPAPAAETPVAIVAERGPHYAVAVLACWRRGLVPLPVNPALPDAQVAAALRDGGCRTALASPAQRDRLASFPLQVAVPRLRGNADPAAVDAARADWRPRTAAVLLTSGTSARPRPVMVPVVGLEARIAWTAQIYPSERPVLLANAAPGFDIGLWEIAWPLSRGGTLIIADDDEIRDPLSFLALLDRSRADSLHVTPTFAGGLLQDHPHLPHLRLIVTGGETVPPLLVDRLQRCAPGAEVWQGYGPTEASVSVADQRCAPGMASLERAPIGRPMAGSVVRLLDSALRPVPHGAVGMICIGGPVISAGYLGRPRESAAAFIPDPFGAPGDRLFRSGDLGRWRVDGLLEHLGRADRQVKIRGFRVQPEAVEHVLRSHPAIEQAAVTVDPDAAVPALEAYVVPAQRVAAPGRDELRAWQARELPPWAVAERIHRVDSIPLTHNGKLDYRRLSGMARALDGGTGGGREEALDLSPLERAISEAWTEAMGTPPCGRHVNFFEAGGHSMAAMRLIAALQRRLGDRCTVRVPLLFKFPTVAGLAEAMRAPLEGAGAVHLRRIGPATEAKSGAPLVLIHPVEGLPTAYWPLAARLPHRTIYTIDDPRFGSDRGFASLEEMAALYLEWVRATLPEGPLILGGWSFGGAVALEMARLMSHHDVPPAALFLIDSYDFAGRGDAFAAGIALPDRLDATGLGADGEIPFDAAELRREIARNTALAVAAHAAEYPHPATLFAASRQDSETVRQLGSGNGWARRLTQLAVRTVEGDHRSIMAPDSIGCLAAALDECWP